MIPAFYIVFFCFAASSTSIFIRQPIPFKDRWQLPNMPHIDHVDNEAAGVRMKWSTPIKSDVDQTEVHVVRLGGSPLYEMVPATQTDYLFTNLTPCQRLTVQVRNRNAKGSSPWATERDIVWIPPGKTCQ
ncbi:unnamed protein product [Calicophoron daubneyi]|uniref:Fibronectin type-III domain-containing protein n=1 Tax=Calicophoron daubneyi TaxID=300641 RepID=A0AAV2TGL4_CALDB